MGTINYNNNISGYRYPDNVVDSKLTTNNYFLTPYSYNFLFKNNTGIIERVEFNLPEINNLFLVNNTIFTTK